MKSNEYLRLLSEQYPTIQETSTEIVRLTSSLDLPKETEHFLSDIHGAHEAFFHLLKNGSGAIRRSIDELFQDQIPAAERRSLATLIYYPERKLPLLIAQADDPGEWYHITIHRLIKLCREKATKYTRSAVRESLPKTYFALIEELLYPQENMPDRGAYYQRIIETLIEVGQAPSIIEALAHLVQRLTIGHLHIIGDIYDRGPGAHIIMDYLMQYHSVDILWGNHDIVWMGAAAGSDACIANVIRVSLRYGNYETLENGYGISLLPLVSFAMDVYREDKCEQFMPRMEDSLYDASRVEDYEKHLLARMQKAISVIQFKLEGQIIQRRKHYEMDNRLMLDKMDLERGQILLDGQWYDLADTNFPTITMEEPYRLSQREQNLVDRLRQSFLTSDRLQDHVRFLFAKGSMYKVQNGNLLYHGCIALNQDGSFVELEIDGKRLSGKSYMARVERLARQGYFASDPDTRQYGQDAMWYLWVGPRSPLFGKDKMATFERYFIADASTHIETKNPYYAHREDIPTIKRILEEFGLDPDTGRIVNGHVPVRVTRGQSPVMADGKLLVIDGGLSKAYQKETGIAGYTLISNSNGLLLAEHRPFESAQKAVQDEIDLDSKTQIIHSYQTRLRVRDSDRGGEIMRRIDDLRALLDAYREGIIKAQ